MRTTTKIALDGSYNEFVSKKAVRSFLCTCCSYVHVVSVDFLVNCQGGEAMPYIYASK